MSLKRRGCSAFPRPKGTLAVAHGLCFSVRTFFLPGPRAHAGRSFASRARAASALADASTSAAPPPPPVLPRRPRVAAVNPLPAGAGAGYGLAFVAQRPTQVAVLTIGYGDGLPRSLTGGEVLLGGRRAPIIGRICMDQTLVDVTDLPAVQPGDEAILIGSAGQETITAYDLARQTDTITNEILSQLGTRLERILS